MINAIDTKAFAYRKKYGLLLTDTDAEFVSWKKGELERIAVFTNDDDGLTRFAVLIKQNPEVYKNASFRILANIIGEDYRVEKTAHLIGKYKLDFHKRRMQQLFRGVTLAMSAVMGREERGRREDVVLFYGMLSETKVLPWINTIIRNPILTLEAVLPISFATAPLVKKISDKWRKEPVLLITLHEKGLLRQTYCDRGGQVHFSRVSKISDNSAEEVAAAVKKELERTIQYLGSLKIAISQGVNIDFICPANMVGQLRELVKSSGRIRFNFHDASAIAQMIGLKSALGELGRDSSLSLHLMQSYTWIQQLAKFDHIRYYWMRLAASVATMAFVAYGLWGGLNVALVGLDGVTVTNQTSQLTIKRDQLQRQYDEEFGQLEDPPSAPQNITAVSETFRVLSQIEIIPSQLIYYFAKGYAQNKLLQLNDMRWYLTGAVQDTEGNASALVQGEDIYQVLEVTGQFLPVQGESYIDVADRADLLVDSFDKRGDVEVQVLLVPGRELSSEVLGGTLTEDFDIDAARDRDFHLRIIWKKYDANSIAQIRNQQI